MNSSLNSIVSTDSTSSEIEAQIVTSYISLINSRVTRKVFNQDYVWDGYVTDDYIEREWIDG